MREIIAALVLAVASSASAFESLDNLFVNLSKMAGVDSTRVDYTGSWPVNGAPFAGFAMGRHEGRGHTRGTRIAVPEIGINLVDSIIDAFNAAGSWGQASGNYLTSYDENNKIVYGMFFNEPVDSLYFVRAMVEAETSLPYDWPYRDRYDSSDSVQVFQAGIIPREGDVDFMEALVRLYDEVKYNFVFFNRISSRWERLYRRSLKAMKAATDDDERLRILRRMVAACGDGHTYIFGHTVSADHSPFTTVMLHDGLYINTVESHELIQAGMRRGQKVVGVNGELPEVWAERELRPYVCSSTPQWTVHEMYDNYNFSRVGRGTQMNLTLLNPDGSLTEVAHKAAEAKRDPTLAYHRDLDFKVMDDKIGILTIPHFQTNETTNFFDSIFPDLLTTEALIIDIRGNGGGNSGFANYIARHFIDSPIMSGRWTTRVYRPAYASWGYDEDVYLSGQDTITPVEDIDRYTRPVVMLTDRGTFSAAEDFTALLKSAGRITQIGTPTGGSTGNGVRPSLTGEGAISANICTKHDTAPDGTEFVGVGLLPEIVVEEAAASYFDPERDAVIEAALTLLRGQQSR